MANDTAADCLQSNLLQLAPKIIAVAEKRNLALEEAKNLLHLCKATATDDDNDDSGDMSAGTNFFFNS
jgi:hypothetical protein